MSESKLMLEYFRPIQLTTKFKINVHAGCWEWTAGKSDDGYGKISKRLSRIKVKGFRAHRVVLAVIGCVELEKGKVVDHKCKNKLCVNPQHLRQVTVAVNTTENSDNFTAKNKLKTHCIRGHEFTKENTYIRIRKGNIGRQCLFCMKARHERDRLKRIYV